MKSKASISKTRKKVKSKVARKVTKNATKKTAKKKVTKKASKKAAKKVAKKTVKKAVRKSVKQSIPRNTKKKISRKKSIPRNTAKPRKKRGGFTKDEEEILRLIVKGEYQRQLQELVVKKRTIRDEALAKRAALKEKRNAKRLVLQTMTPEDAERVRIMNAGLTEFQKKSGLREEEFIRTRGDGFIYPSIMERTNHGQIKKRIFHFANRVVALYNLGSDVEESVRDRLGPFCDIALTAAEFIDNGVNEREYIERQAEALGKEAREVYTDILSPPKWMLDELEDFELEHMYELNDET